MTGLTAWLAETAVAVTLLIALVIVLRVPVRHWLGVGAAYGIWIVPALRLLLPPVRADSLPGPVRELPRLVADPISLAAPASAPPVSGGLHEALPWLLVLVWLAGAACWLCFHAWRYGTFLRQHLRFSDPIGRDGRIALYLSDVEGPLAGGLVRRFILLPLDFDRRYDGTERRLVLAHELAHHRRGDIFANAAAVLFVALFWWNPLAHLAHRLFRIDQELACDETVLRGCSRAERRAYGHAILDTALGDQAAPNAALRDRGGLKCRLRLIAAGRPGAGKASLPILAPTAIAALCATVPLVTAAPGLERLATSGTARAAALVPNSPPSAAPLFARHLALQPRRRSHLEPGRVRREGRSAPIVAASAPDLWQGCLAEFAQADRGEGPPSRSCERERNRRLSLTVKRNEVLADPRLADSDRGAELEELERELSHPLDHRL